jgi:hypothetical protein
MLSIKPENVEIQKRKALSALSKIGARKVSLHVS